MKRYKMKLQMLSPVHIGTGYEIPPYEYVVKESSKDNFLFYRIDLYRFLASLDNNQREDFEIATRSTNVTAVRKYIADNVDVDQFALYKNEIMPDFYNDYQKKINSIENQLLVSEIPRRLNDYRPYIPGSSIKGAIRTAIVSEMDKHLKPVPDDYGLKNSMKKIINTKNEWMLMKQKSFSTIATRNKTRSGA
jgi:CRISPR-associated protein Csm5